MQALLNAAMDLHRTHAELAAFCPAPTDVVSGPVKPHMVPAAKLMQADRSLHTDDYIALRDALVAATPHVMWRETYKDTAIGADFMARFGCYEVIGRDAPFLSAQIRSFVVYQPPGLHYPWHHHPADEIYVVLAGEAEFHLEGQESRTLQPGDASFHPGHRPHALTTHANPVMAYVVWRDEFDTPPVWTNPP